MGRSHKSYKLVVAGIEAPRAGHDKEEQISTSSSGHERNKNARAATKPKNENQSLRSKVIVDVNDQIAKVLECVGSSFIGRSTTFCVRHNTKKGGVFVACVQLPASSD